MLVGPMKMLSVRDRRDRPPEEGVVAELQGFAVDKAFFTSHKGILLETELVTAASPTWCLHFPDPWFLASLMPVPSLPFSSLPPQALWTPLLPPAAPSSSPTLPSCCLCTWRHLQPVSVAAGRTAVRQDDFLGH